MATEQKLSTMQPTSSKRSSCKGDNIPTQQDFRTIGWLGKGAFAHVLLVSKNGGTDANRKYAMKIIQRKQLSRCMIGTTQNERKVSAELSPRTIKFPQIVSQVMELIVNRNCLFLARLVYAFKTSSHLFLVMEFERRGSLKDVMRSKPHNIASLAQDFYLPELLLALEQLHEVSYS